MAKMLMEGAIMGKSENKEKKLVVNVSTGLGDVSCPVPTENIPDRGYVLVLADVRKGNSAQGAYVRITDAHVVSILGNDSSLETIADNIGGLV